MCSLPSPLLGELPSARSERLTSSSLAALVSPCCSRSRVPLHQHPLSLSFFPPASSPYISPSTKPTDWMTPSSFDLHLLLLQVLRTQPEQKYYPPLTFHLLPASHYNEAMPINEEVPMAGPKVLPHLLLLQPPTHRAETAGEALQDGGAYSAGQTPYGWRASGPRGL